MIYLKKINHKYNFIILKNTIKIFKIILFFSDSNMIINNIIKLFPIISYIKLNGK